MTPANYSIFDRYWDGVVVLDRSGHIVYRNESITEMARLGVSRLRVGRHIDDYFFFSPSLYRKLEEINEPTQIREINFTTQTGHSGAFQTFLLPSPFSSSEEPQWIVFFKDLTIENRLTDKYWIEKNRRRELKLKMQLDPLTEIYNRGYFDFELKKTFTQAQKWNFQFSMILFDIDDFKKINDTYGHQAGDFVLKKIASHLTENVLRNQTYLFRYGGEEFAILLTREPLKTAQIVAERVRASIESLNLTYKDMNLRVTVSVGVAEFQNDMESHEDLTKLADMASYESKKKGKNCVTAASSTKAA